VYSGCSKFGIHSGRLSIDFVPALFKIFCQCEVDTSLLLWFLGLPRASDGEALIEHITNIFVHFPLVVLEQYGLQWVVDIERIE
jgi:hypothetical protein